MTATPIFLTLLLATAGANAADKVSLELKWFSQFQFAGYYTALEKGYYADEGLDVQIHERDPKKFPIDLVLGGKADFGISDASLILHRMHGRPVVVLAAIFQHSPLVLLTRAEDVLLGPHELKGKKVMRQKGIDDASIAAMFDHEGMVTKDVIDVPHSFDDMALLKGQTDAQSAYITNQPFLYEQAGFPIHIINPTNYGIDFYGDMLFTSERIMRNKPNLALRFRRASIKGWKYALDNPEEVIGWLLEKYGSKKSLDHLRFEAVETARMIQPNLVEIGHLNSGRFQRIANIYRTQNMVPQNSDSEGVDYRDYLQADGRMSQWILWIGGAAAAFGILTLILLTLNRRLGTLVEERSRDLKAARDSLQSYVDIVDKHIITSSTDTQGRITYASEAFAKISKYGKGELMGRAHNIVRHTDMPKEIYRDMWKTISAGKGWHGEIKNRAKDGSAYWVDVNIEPDFLADGSISGYTAIRYDITDKKHIEELSVTDRLTGLYNRLKLDETFTQEMERSTRYDHPLSVVLLDIDHFKSVNDTFGHQTGDAVLVKITELLTENIRIIDVAGRWGGEEFLIICPETTLEHAVDLANKIRIVIGDHVFPVVGKKTASFGVASLASGESEGNLIARADEALYRAKKGDRNRVEAAS
ncbi:diguanylate cyclase [Magnetovibrio blakemorei]|nr:diguanylate cyclase [Magnetovibrio blakemorei]